MVMRVERKYRVSDEDAGQQEMGALVKEGDVRGVVACQSLWCVPSAERSKQMRDPGCEKSRKISSPNEIGPRARSA